ncbi:Thioesterase-like superfamily protein [Gemmobacter megaterium]|uniref:Thioesterase-like superfamily protein n=2 Tax=Gemmobacter megaterium TaxID=1086013 RepID=A0A1N7PDH0_9RHOB|nr:Thioesterase-like superfamily protein [Gemmobacter megaterium]
MAALRAGCLTPAATAGNRGHCQGNRMYPYLRMGLELYLARRRPSPDPLAPWVSRHTCLPWDLDPWCELNNGRTLTLFDLGRVPFAHACGMSDALRAGGWGMTVAGTSVRYRRRIRLFDTVTMVTRVLGWDERFVYVDQTMWNGDECTTQAVPRLATTSANGIVPPARLLEKMGVTRDSPALPGWLTAWIDADRQRPWPPEAGAALRG